MDVEEFEEFIKQDCEKRGVKIDASLGRYVEFENSKSNGFFFDEKTEGGPKLAYAKGQPLENWFVVAVHEYNHMLQWASGDPIWHNETLPKSDKYLWKWLEGEVELTSEDAREYALCNMRVELDCERRTIKMAQDLGLPIDISAYIKKANSYVLFYHLLLKHRRWYDIGKEPYSMPELVKQMPEDLYSLDYENPSEEMINLFEIHMPYILEGHKEN